MWPSRVPRWISHGAAKVVSIDARMDMGTWAWADMDMDIDMDTSRKQWIGFCTWTDALIERAMSWQC